MKIAIYHPWIRSKGGCERVILELVTRLKKHEWTIFTHYFEPNSTFPEYRKLKIVNLGKKIEPKGFLLRGLVFGINILSTKIKNLKNFDILLVSTSGIGELITLRNHEIPTICYCHTTLRAAHEFYEYYKTRMHDILKKIGFILGVRIYRILEKIAWREFKLVLCNSRNVKNRIINAGLFPIEKIVIVHPGVDIKKFKPNWKFEKYFYVPGRFKSYKRFELAIEAFKLFREKKKGCKLILAGYPDDKKYFLFIKEFVKNDKDIRIVESPSEEENIKLYKNCWAVIFTAKEEDWGLIPLEAMACGKPVIAVNEGGVKESVVNNKTGFLVKATPEKICEKMLLLTNNPPLTKKMGRMGRTYSAKFDWSVFIKKFENILREIK